MTRSMPPIRAGLVPTTLNSAFAMTMVSLSCQGRIVGKNRIRKFPRKGAKVRKESGRIFYFASLRETSFSDCCYLEFRSREVNRIDDLVVTGAAADVAGD